MEELESLDAEEMRDAINYLIREVKELKEERDNFKEKLRDALNNKNEGWW